MESLGKRIRLLRTKANLSMSKLAEEINAKSSNISDWENGKTNPSSVNLLALSKFFGVSSDWLLTGHDHTQQNAFDPLYGLSDESKSTVQTFIKFLRSQENVDAKVSYKYGQDTSTISAHEEKELYRKSVYVPILGDAAAGFPIEIIELQDGTIPVDQRHSRYNAFIVRARGDSMTGDGIHNGDLVVVRPQPNIENGEIALVNTNDKATIKHFYRHSDKCELRSSNPLFKPMFYNCDNIVILGKIVEVVGKNLFF